MSGAEVSFSTPRVRVTPATSAGEIYTKPSSLNSSLSTDLNLRHKLCRPVPLALLMLRSVFFKNATTE